MTDTADPPCNDDAPLPALVADPTAPERLGRCIYGHTPAIQPGDLHLANRHCIRWEPVSDREHALIGQAFTVTVRPDGTVSPAAVGGVDLTDDEKAALGASATMANALRRVIGDGPQATTDWNECAGHIHDLQARIVMGVAARAGLCRPLGGTAGPPNPYTDTGFCQGCSKVRDNVDNDRGVCASCADYLGVRSGD